MGVKRVQPYWKERDIDCYALYLACVPSGSLKPSFVAADRQDEEFHPSTRRKYSFPKQQAPILRAETSTVDIVAPGARQNELR